MSDLKLKVTLDFDDAKAQLSAFYSQAARPVQLGGMTAPAQSQVARATTEGVIRGNWALDTARAIMSTSVVQTATSAGAEYVRYNMLKGMGVEPSFIEEFMQTRGGVAGRLGRVAGIKDAGGGWAVSDQTIDSFLQYERQYGGGALARGEARIRERSIAMFGGEEGLAGKMSKAAMVEVATEFATKVVDRIISEVFARLPFANIFRRRGGGR